MTVELARRRRGGNERAFTVAHLEELFGGEALVDAEHRVLIHAKLACELADGGNLVPGGQSSGEALRTNLVGNLPGDRNRGPPFNADEHARNPVVFGR